MISGKTFQQKVTSECKIHVKISFYYLFFGNCIQEYNACLPPTRNSSQKTSILPISCHYCLCLLPSPHFSFPLPFLPFYNSLNSMNALICMAQGHPWRHGHPTMDHTLEGNQSSLIRKWPSTTKRSLLRGGAL